MDSSRPILDEAKTEVNFAVSTSVHLPVDRLDTFHIIMRVQVYVETYFTLNTAHVGDFNVTGDDITAEVRNSFVNVNAPAIMFPYVRAFINTLTANLGNVVIAINLPPQSFSGQLELEETEDGKIQLGKVFTKEEAKS